MLNPDTATLLTEAISHLRGTHEVERGNVLRDFKFKMANQGILQSSMFKQGKAKIYYEAYEKHAKAVWQEMRRVLEQIGFDAYSGCETDLAQMLKTSLADAYAADKRSLGVLEKFGVYMPEATFDFHYGTVLARLATEIKIFAKQVRAMKQKEKPQAITQNTYHLHGTGSRVNIGSTDQSINIITEP